jgi:hypothetical protein
MPVDDGGRSPATLVCKGCNEPFANPRALAVHEERHRPVEPPVIDPATNRETTFPCSAGCSRNFRTLAQFREHAPICDGMPPLTPFSQEKGMPEIGGRPLTCPECLVDFQGDHDKLAVHIERHREVGAKIVDKRTGDVESRECPKGCGRHFLSKKDFKEHTTLCDGSAPLPVKKDREALIIIDEIPISRLGKKKGRKEGDGGMGQVYKCTDCGKEFDRPNTLGIHRKYKHGVAGKGRKAAGGRGGARKRAEPAATPARADTGNASADGAGLLGQLRDAAQSHRTKADRIEELAKELETLL